MTVFMTEYLRIFLPTFFPKPLALQEVAFQEVGGGVVVVVGSCGFTDSGTSASPPSFPVIPLTQNPVNECCMKSLGQACCWKWT